MLDINTILVCRTRRIFKFEACHEKTCLRCFQPGSQQTRLCSPRKWLEARNFGFRKWRECYMYLFWEDKGADHLRADLCLCFRILQNRDFLIFSWRGSFCTYKNISLFHIQTVNFMLRTYIFLFFFIFSLCLLPIFQINMIKVCVKEFTDTFTQSKHLKIHYHQSKNTHQYTIHLYICQYSFCFGICYCLLNILLFYNKQYNK